MPIDDRVSPSSMSEIDSALSTTNTASLTSERKSHSGFSSMSDREEENFECYGENEDVECDSDSSPPDRVVDDVDASTLRTPPNSLPPSNLGKRNSWVRRSLRGSPSKTSEALVTPKRWGSFRHRSREGVGVRHNSSLGDFMEVESEADEGVYREEVTFIHPEKQEDALYLLQKVHMLQQQVGVLAENQVNTDDRYTRVKQDNSALQARIMMLEEQLRETEMRGEDRLSDEQKRNKELMARVEREKQLTIENYSMKYASVEKDKKILTEENQRLNNQLEKLHKDKLLLEDRVSEAEFTSSATQQENSKLGEMSRRDKEELRIERERGSQVIEELRCEVERLRAVEESYRKRSSSVDSHSGTSSELLTELKKVKDENKQLLEQVEELEAQLLTMRLEEGRTLVSSAATSNSLAAEFEQMTSDELRNSLIDAQEANQHLRSYIDGILLTIVENYPQLLEVKQK